MGTTADKLQYLINAKNSISAAIETKGGTVPQELSGYADAIAALPSGGNSELANKLIDRSVTEIAASDLSSVTSIGEYAFARCSNLANATIPSNITGIGSYAFYYASKIKDIVIPDSVLSVGNSAFRYASQLSSATIGTGVTQIPQYAFGNCSKLSSIEFGTTRTTVPTLANVNAFYSLPSNYLIYVPYDLYDSWCSTGYWTNISGHIVANVPWEEGDTIVLSSATGAVWYGSIVGEMYSGSIPASAQTSGTKLIVGSTVTSIGSWALTYNNTFTEVDFSDATSLTSFSGFSLQVPNASSIVFPPSLTNISANAFYNCGSCTLYDFSNFTSIPTLENANAFSSIAAAGGRIKVPELLEDAWKAAPNWSDLAQYIGSVFYDYYVDGTNGSDSNDGSMANPFATIQKAIDESTTGDTIGVKAGTYAPITSENKDITIVAIDGVSSTIIDGGGTSRCATLVTSSNTDPQAGQDVLTKLVGFTLQNGKRTGRESTTGGGNGGGVSGGTLYKCFIKNCTVTEYGSGGGCAGTNAYSCIFYGCTANPNCPAAICSNIINCTLAYNGQTGGTGMGIVGVGSCRNTLIAYNNRVRTIWSSTTVSNNYASTSSSMDSSIFVSPTSDWHLNANSSYVTNYIKNCGSNTYAYGSKDFYNGVRIVNGTIDIGACEVQAS